MRILFCGTPDFAATVLDALLDGPHPVVGVVSQPGRPAGRGLEVSDPPAAARARAAGLPVLQTARLHAPETLQYLHSLEPDLIVTAAFGRILRPALLSLPPRGCWNVHASLLPRHRGASPVSAAMLAGDSWTGVTLFRMEEGLDTGPILMQEMTPIAPEETAGDLTERLARMGGRMVREALDLAAGDALSSVLQPAYGATYAPILTKEDGRILWNRPADQVERTVRALTPWPGAFTFVQGKRLRVYRMKAEHRVVAHPFSAPGTVFPSKEGIGVACLPGQVLLLEVQSEGKKRQEASVWLRGNPLPAGTRLDPPV